MLSLAVSTFAASFIPQILGASTVTFYAVPSGPTGLAGTSPSISPISTGNDGSTTYNYDFEVTQIPEVTFASSRTLDFGTGFPFGGVVGPFNLPGAPTTTLVNVPKTTLSATLIADSTRNVLSYNGPRATGNTPSYPSFIQDCRFNQDHSQGTCTYLEGVLRTGDQGNSNANSQNQESFNGNVVPVYSAVINGNSNGGNAKSSSSSSSGSTSSSESVTTVTSSSTDGNGNVQAVTMTSTATVPAATNTGSSNSGGNSGAAKPSQDLSFASLTLVTAGFVVAVVSLF